MALPVFIEGVLRAKYRHHGSGSGGAANWFSQRMRGWCVMPWARTWAASSGMGTAHFQASWCRSRMRAEPSSQRMVSAAGDCMFGGDISAANVCAPSSRPCRPAQCRRTMASMSWSAFGAAGGGRKRSLAANLAGGARVAGGRLRGLGGPLMARAPWKGGRIRRVLAPWKGRRIRRVPAPWKGGRIRRAPVHAWPVGQARLRSMRSAGR